MKRFVACLAAASAVTVICQVAASQSATGINPDEIKHALVPMPRGRVRAEAREIDKEWNSRIVHLKGNARVRIYTAMANPRGVIVMRADEVDLNQTTGEISPRGNVRLTVEEMK